MKAVRRIAEDDCRLDLSLVGEPPELISRARKCRPFEVSIELEKGEKPLRVGNRICCELDLQAKEKIRVRVMKVEGGGVLHHQKEEALPTKTQQVTLLRILSFAEQNARRQVRSGLRKE